MASFSQRERYIGWATLSVLALLALDRYVWSPLQERSRQLAVESDAVTVEEARVQELFTNNRKRTRQWNAMVAAGLKSDPSDAEAQALHALQNWAEQSGLTLSSLKPERVDRQKYFRQISLRAIATGSMQSVGEFLYRIQAAEIPIRVTDFQITARTEGSDDLQLTLGVSTIYPTPPEERQKAQRLQPQRPTTPARPGAGA